MAMPLLLQLLLLLLPLAPLHLHACEGSCGSSSRTTSSWSVGGSSHAIIGKRRRLHDVAGDDAAEPPIPRAAGPASSSTATSDAGGSSSSSSSSSSRGGTGFRGSDGLPNPAAAFDLAPYAPVLNGKLPNVVGLKDSRDIVWDPPRDRYLVADCFYGRLSNRVMCLHHHLILAGMLNRTLVVDSASEETYGYVFPTLLDARHIRTCYGPRAAFSSAELMEARGGRRLELDAYLCSGWRCKSALARDDPYIVSHRPPPKLEKVLSLRRFENVVSVCSRPEYANLSVIAVGDLFRFVSELPHALFFEGRVPFVRRRECPNKLAIQPQASIVAAAVKYVEERLAGQAFVGVHVRRGDFLKKYCAAGGAPAGLNKTNVSLLVEQQQQQHEQHQQQHWHPGLCLDVTELARCVVQTCVLVRIRTIVLISDMRGHEMHAFVAMIRRAAGHAVTRIIVKPAEEQIHKTGEAWRGDKYGTFSKVVLSMAYVFKGTPFSTYTADIVRLRYGWGTTNCHDGFICEGILF